MPNRSVHSHHSATLFFIVRALAAILVLATLAVGAAGCGDSKTVTKDEYHASVVNARDRTDYALAEVTRQKTKDAFLSQMDTSADLIDGAANDFDSAGSAPGFEDESAALVKQLHQLAADLAGTAEQIRTPGYEGLLDSKGLSFQSWIDINKTFGSLTKQGIAVQPLGRH